MSEQSFWTRLKEAHIWRVLLVYLAASWVLLQLAATLNELFELPSWVGPVTLVLLFVGLLVTLATAWVQSHPLTEEREAADEVPESWEVDVKGLGEAISRGRLPHLTWARAVLGGVFAFSVLFGFAGLYVLIQDRGQSFVPDEAIAGEADPGIAFLPFTVSGAGLEHLREGMVTLLFASLDGAAGLRAISDRTVLAQWDRLVGSGQRADLETAMRVAGETGARYTLLGSVVSVGPRLQLSGDIYELADGRPLGRVQLEGSADSLQALVEDLAVETLRALAQAGVETVPRADLRGVTTHSLPALTAYLEGEANFRRGDFDASIPHFEAALELDSTFALAHYRMFYATGWAADGNPIHLEKAIAGNLTPRMQLLAWGSAGFEPELGDELEALVLRYPDDAEAWFVLGDWYTHIMPFGYQDPVGRAKKAFARAAELDAGFAPYVIHLIDYAFNQNDAAEAARWIAEYRRAAPGSALGESFRLAHRLVFEPTLDSLAFEAAIDSLARTQAERPGLVLRLLNHPRLSGIGTGFLLRRAEATGELNGSICWKFALAQGGWTDFLAYIDDPRLAPGWRFLCLVHAHWRGYPVSEELLEEAWSEVAEGSAMRWEELTYAAETERWEEFENRFPALQATPQQTANAPIIEGFRLWRAGDLERAAATLETSPQLPPVRWWLGQINLELGRLDAAEWYFSSFFDSPLGEPWTRSLYYLGLVYEQKGEREKAREAYAEFLDIWNDADPELELLKEQVRERLEAIPAERS